MKIVKDKKIVEYITVTHLILILANMHAASGIKIADLLHSYLWTDDEYNAIAKIIKDTNND